MAAKRSRKKKTGRGVARQFSHVKAPTRKKGRRSKIATPVEKLSSRQSSRRHRNRMTDKDKTVQKQRDKVNRDRRSAKSSKVKVSGKQTASKHQFVDHHTKTMTHDDYLGEKAKGKKYGPVGELVQKIRYRKYNKTGPESQFRKATKSQKGQIGKGDLAYRKARSMSNFGLAGLAYNKIKYRKSRYDVV